MKRNKEKEFVGTRLIKIIIQVPKSWIYDQIVTPLIARAVLELSLPVLASVCMDVHSTAKPTQIGNLATTVSVLIIEVK